MAQDWLSKVFEVFKSIGRVFLDIVISFVTVINNLPWWVKSTLFLIAFLLSLMLAIHIYRNREEYFKDFADL